MTAFVRTANLQRGEPFEILVDGRPITAHPGESLAAALLAAGLLSFAAPPAPTTPRGVYCGMGACYGCLVTLEGAGSVRACATLAQPGQRVDLNGHERR